MPMISRRNSSSPSPRLRRVSMAAGSMMVSDMMKGGGVLVGPFAGGVGLDLVDGGEAEEDFFESVVAEGSGAEAGGGGGDCLAAGVGADEAADFLADDEQFVEGDAAFVAGAAAGGAAAAAVEVDVGVPGVVEIALEDVGGGGVNLLAVFADAGGEAL